MPNAVVQFATQNPLLVAGALGALLVAWWFVDEYRDAGDAEEAARGAGQRAQAATEAAARGSRYAVVGLAGLGASLAMEALHLASGLNEVLGGAPVIVGHLIYGVLSLAGIAGAIPFDKELAGFAFAFITAIALILRFGDDDG